MKPLLLLAGFKTIEGHIDHLCGKAEMRGAFIQARGHLDSGETHPHGEVSVKLRQAPR